MTRFRDDNTEGYSADELDELNEAFEQNMATVPDWMCGDDLAAGSYQDHVAEMVLSRFDRGLRGDDLLW